MCDVQFLLVSTDDGLAVSTLRQQTNATPRGFDPLCNKRSLAVFSSRVR